MDKNSELLCVSYYEEENKLYGIVLINLFFNKNFYYKRSFEYVFEYQILNTKIITTLPLNLYNELSSNSSVNSDVTIFISGKEPQIFNLYKNDRTIKIFNVN